ncbi:DUF4815 domain-containing protein [Cohaesibacter sp. CAU 1516]|nr:DUF4815 domain-containing protein [Cohaesibacter sp. CAU 1516]
MMATRDELNFVIDRAVDKPEWKGVTFHGEQPLIQGGELNELQTIARARTRRIGNLIANDGDRIAGALAIVDIEAAAVTLEAGEIYIAGDVLTVEAQVLDPVSMVGLVEIGVRLIKSELTDEEYPQLKGQVPGSDAEGEPGAAREIWSLTWGLVDDGGDGDFYRVYSLQDGAIIDQTPPPALEGVTAAIAQYDRVRGNYIVSGCRVTALGKDGTKQYFSIEQGEANIQGRKRTRFAALRIGHEEDFEVAAVPGETHVIASSDPTTLTVAYAPIAEVSQVLIEKEKTVQITRGTIANGVDGLPDNSVTSIISVVQGGTTYVRGTDYQLTAGGVDWQLPGAEPAESTTYNVTYRYRAVVVPDAFDATSITVSGSAAGGQAILAYTYKLPRIDLICLDKDGFPAYVNGVPGSTLEPQSPADLLKLAEVHNDWFGTPTVVNNGTFAPTYDELARRWAHMENMTRMLQLSLLEAQAVRRDNARVRNTFVDPFLDDSNRDAGEPQNAAVFGGLLQLPIASTFYTAPLSGPVLLDYVEEVIIAQEAQSGCEPINPYQNFNPMPGAMELSPQADYWTVSTTEWASPETEEFQRGTRWDGGPLQTVDESTRSLGSRTEQAEFMRSISVTATIKGLSEGEQLAELTFDGRDVKPAGVQTADAQGEIEVAFTIPEGVTTGTKQVFAKSAAGLEAWAAFTAEGSINVETLQRVTSISIWQRGVVDLVEQSSSDGFTNWSQRGGGGSGEGGNTGDSDPQAQTFTPAETRQVIGVDFKLCAIGGEENSILVNQVTVENGDPTSDIVSEGFVPMAGAAVGWKGARYRLPVLTESDREHAFVIKTDDGVHAVAEATLGALDVVNQRYITAQPYTVGVRLSSSNAKSWTPHQNSDLTFRLIAARYTQTTKTVDLGSHALVNCSDLQVRAGVFVPSGDCSVTFEIERTNGVIYRLTAGQVLSLDEYITESVQLRAVLRGTEKLSPILFAPVILIAGEIAQSATYISKAFKIGANVRLTDYFRAFLPPGAGASVHYDQADDNWVELPLTETEALFENHWSDRRHEASGVSAVEGRVKITLTGGPDARPLIGDQAAAIY